MNTGSAAKRPYQNRSLGQRFQEEELAEGEAVVGAAELRRMREAMERMQVQV